MADETTDGPGATGPSDEDPGPSEVLGNLPTRRPARRSSKRSAATPEADAPAPAKVTRRTSATGGSARSEPTARATAAKGPKRAAAPKRPAAARGAKAPAPVARATSAPPPPPEPVLAAPAAAPPRAAAPHLPGVDLAMSATVTAIEAAGELAQIGFTFTRQVVRATVGRLPRP